MSFEDTTFGQSKIDTPYFELFVRGYDFSRQSSWDRFNWYDFVDERIKTIWPQLTDGEKGLVWMLAEQMAEQAEIALERSAGDDL